MQRVLNATTSTFLRYAYADIDWSNRLLGLVGPRGVGKTTLFLQHIKLAHSQDDALYVSADHMYFADHTLYDTAEALYKSGGHYFYIDEVHKYPTWSRELKAKHDAFPDLHVYFTGSSILDIETVRETFFLNQMRVGHAVTASRCPDFKVDGITFEIGGKSKTQSQIKDIEQGYVAKDDIEYGNRSVIPLWAFGLIY